MKRRKTKKSKPSNNRGGTKVEYDGIIFDSKLELYCYKQLKENKIKATYEGKTFTIMDAFTYNDEKIRKAVYTPDFVGDKFIIECKGHPNGAWPYRWKMFKYYLYRNNINIDLYIPRNKKQVDEVIENILRRSREKNST